MESKIVNLLKSAQSEGNFHFPIPLILQIVADVEYKKAEFS
jgi:hypothetical protein